MASPGCANSRSKRGSASTTCRHLPFTFPTCRPRNGVRPAAVHTVSSQRSRARCASRVLSARHLLAGVPEAAAGPRRARSAGTSREATCGKVLSDRSRTASPMEALPRSNAQTVLRFSMELPGVESHTAMADAKAICAPESARGLVQSTRATGAGHFGCARFIILHGTATGARPG